MTKVLIMAGGTGGHVFPALAVADVLHKQNVAVEWMGTAQGIEAKLVPGAGYPLNIITVQGLRGNGLLGWLLAPFKLLKAIIEAIAAIREIKPDVVLGLGGFASGPGGLATWLLRKPLLIHEQNAIPGLTNRVLSHLAKYVLAGFPYAFSTDRKAQWVGNPVRASIENLPTPSQRFADRTATIRILVLGGSLGARALNTLLPQAFATLEQDIEIHHQCGQRHIADCQANYQQANVPAEISTFIDDMADAYGWADLVVCRAGALTVAELAAAGVASLLVPYPYAVDDHQTHNAAMLVNVSAAKLVQESDLNQTVLAEMIAELIKDRQSLLVMAEQARSQAKLGSANTIATLCLEFANG